MRFTLSLLSLTMLLASSSLSAKEGMWLPFLIQQGVIDSMQAAGLQLDADDLYSETETSMKDAIVIFGGGCTGEFISENGLLLTNHHCGMGSIQKLSSLENNYVDDGFWAKSKEEEIPTPGLTVKLMQKAVDLSKAFERVTINAGDESERQYLIDSLRNYVLDTITAGEFDKNIIKGFFNDQQFYLITYTEYADVRYVGSPPYYIGKFGGETDNWVWPRHTGDFSVFRVYANAENQPSAYNEENKPYTPKKHFQIAANGVEEGDFTMVYGFPGSTEENMSSYQLDYEMNVVLPMRIKLRTHRLDVMDKYMKTDEAIKLNYIAKYAGVSNGWKKFKGIINGLTKVNALQVKQDNEKALQEWANDKPAFKSTLPEIKDAVAQYNELFLTRTYVIESLLGIEAVSKAISINNSIQKDGDAEKARKIIEGFHKTYSVAIDKEITTYMITSYLEHVENAYYPDKLNEVSAKYKGNVEAFVEALFKKSAICSSERFSSIQKLKDDKFLKKLNEDPVLVLAQDVLGMYYMALSPAYDEVSFKLDSLNRQLLNMMMAYQPKKVFYPDANFTMRITFGEVASYEPRDAVKYDYKTTLNGIYEKYMTGNPDFNIEPEFLSVIESGDYGTYFTDSTAVCFVASNHTSGGNSGSPLLNAKGQLVGLNFDRSWEGTMSDYYYDVTRCRNISVDIRYFLFVLEKVAKANNLLEELDIVGLK